MQLLHGDENITSQYNLKILKKEKINYGFVKLRLYCKLNATDRNFLNLS